MSLTKHKNKIVYEKVLVVKSIHNSEDCLQKVWKLQMKFSEFDCLTGYFVLFLCYLKLISFSCYLKLLCFYVICSYVIRYVIFLSVKFSLVGRFETKLLSLYVTFLYLFHIGIRWQLAKQGYKTGDLSGSFQFTYISFSNWKGFDYCHLLQAPTYTYLLHQYQDMERIIYLSKFSIFKIYVDVFFMYILVK